MVGGHALSSVLEAVTGFLRVHAGQRLNLARELLVLRQLLVHRHPMCRAGAAPVIHAAVSTCAVPGCAPQKPRTAQECMTLGAKLQLFSSLVGTLWPIPAACANLNSHVPVPLCSMA